MAPGRCPGPRLSDGISVMLSALFARYEELQRDRVFGVLLPRAIDLVERAARANLNLTIDAEECDRLELSLNLFDALAPAAFEIERIAELREEIFGPVLHVVQWGPEQHAAGAARDVAEVVQQINALGCGLTLGAHTRIDSRVLRIADAARVGNVYVNRNMIGAVVGVQPFGGEAMSGTGPKAGGPHYLYRFCSEQTLTINTAAAGGNAELLAGLS
jgi:delta 1-pyrroline-5-carboxylate dehydrogenase